MPTSLPPEPSSPELPTDHKDSDPTTASFQGEGTGSSVAEEPESVGAPPASAIIQLDELLGLEPVAEHLRRLLRLLRDPAPLVALGAKLPRGLVLCGPRGGGKSSLVQGLCAEAGVALETIVCDGGMGSDPQLEATFRRAAKRQPCVVLVEDIHAWARRGGRGEPQPEGKLVKQLAAQLDAMQGGVLVIATSTADEDELSPQLTRTGRLDRALRVPKLNAQGRAMLLARLFPALAHAELEQLARRTAGHSPLELHALARDAACRAAAEGRTAVTHADVEAERRSFGFTASWRDEASPSEFLRVLARHEAGHAIVTTALPRLNRLSHVSIRPAGDSQGRSVLEPTDVEYKSRNLILDRATAALAGREAELLGSGDLGEVHTGAGQDLRVATHLLFTMVSLKGLDDVLGPISIEGLPEGARHALVPAVLERVQHLLGQCAARARELLITHRAAWEELIELLLAEEEVDGEVVEKLVWGPGGRPGKRA